MYAKAMKVLLGDAGAQKIEIYVAAVSLIICSRLNSGRFDLWLFSNHSASDIASWGIGGREFRGHKNLGRRAHLRRPTVEIRPP